MATKKLPKRQELPQGFTWNLETIYPAEASWEVDFQSVKDQVPRLKSFTGTIADSPAQLLGCLELRDDVTKTMEQLLVYAHMRKDEDNSNN